MDRAVNWLVDFESQVFNHSFISPDEYFNSFNLLISNLNYLKEDDKINLSTKFKKAIKKSEKIPVKFSNKCFRMRDILHEDKTITRVDWGNWLGRDLHPFFIEISTFIAELRELSIYPHISQRKIIKLENHFLRTYWKKTLFSNYKSTFSGINIYYLARYLNSLNKKLENTNFSYLRRLLFSRRINTVQNSINNIL